MNEGAQKVVDKVARTAFGRVNTSISIAIATQVCNESIQSFFRGIHFCPYHTIPR